jgi:hypothetical protein
MAFHHQSPSGDRRTAIGAQIEICPVMLVMGALGSVGVAWGGCRRYGRT